MGFYSAKMNTGFKTNRTIDTLYQNVLPIKIFSHLVTSLFLWVGIAWPWLLLKMNDISQIGFNEESIGYRYFHSLRLLYGDNEFPWLPQGQFTGLFHIIIQWLLTVFGYPIENSRIRIDIFTDLALVMQFTLIAITFLFSVSNLNFTTRLAIAALFLMASYAQSSFNWGMHLFTPDYLIWVLIPACILIGTMVRLGKSQAAPSAWAFALLGLFTGILAAIKITYLTFSITLWITMLLKLNRLKFQLSNSLIVAFAALTTFLLIIWAYYKFNFEHTYIHLQRLSEFTSNPCHNAYFDLAWKWLTTESFSWPISFITISMLTPLLFIYGMIFHVTRRQSFVLLVGSCLSSYICWKRFYGATFVETNAFAAAAIVLFFLLILPPLIRKRPLKIKRQYFPQISVIKHCLQLGMVLILISVAYSESQKLPLNVFGPMARTGESDKALTHFLVSQGGKTLFLIPNNAFRPLTIDSAIHKGGTDTYSRWGQSKLMNSLFSDRWYILGEGLPGTGDNPVLDSFHNIVFTYFPPERDSAIKDLSRFGINIINFSCPFEAKTGNQAIIVACTKNK